LPAPIAANISANFGGRLCKKKANGQVPADNSQLILQGCQFKQVHFKLGFYSKSKKSELDFYSIFA